MKTQTEKFESGKYYRMIRANATTIIKIINTENPEYIRANVLKKYRASAHIEINDVVIWEPKDFIETTEERYNELKEELIKNI